MICFNPGPHFIWCFANGTTLTHFSFFKRFKVQYHLSEFFYRNFLTNGKRSMYYGRYANGEGTTLGRESFKTNFEVVNISGRTFCATGPPQEHRQ